MGCMSKAEIIKLLTIIAAMYSRFEINELKVNLWLDMIGDLPFKVAQLAVKKVMMTSEFPPTVAEVRKAAADITHAKDDVLDAGKAWGEVQDAVRKHGFYETNKALEMMSPLTRQVVEQISWREICLCEEPGVIRGQFMKMYDSMKVRHQQERMLPESFKNQISLLAENMSMARIESAAAKEN